MAELAIGIRRPAHFSTTSALAWTAILWITRRHELVDYFLFEQFAADVDAGGAGGSNPKLGDLFVCVQLEAVNQAQLLDGAHRDCRKNSEVGQDGENSSESETRALNGCKFHTSADH